MDRLWVSWEDHRRSRELAGVFQAEYSPLLSSKPYWMRALSLSCKTLDLLVRHKPKFLFAQNPSILLATLACLLKPVLHYTLVIDRHSNFKLSTLADRSIKMRFFHLLSRWTVRKADLTVVTNGFLKNLIVGWGGRAEVLPDLIPDFAVSPQEKDLETSRFKVVFVAGYGPDEPLDEVLASAGLIGDRLQLFVTGNYRRHGVKPPSLENVCFTGFLEDQEYLQLLANCDVVMALTTESDILNCAAYEAIALGKPLILSDTKLLREYFAGGPVFVAPGAESIAGAIRLLAREAPQRAEMIADLRQRLRQDWRKRQKGILIRLGLTDDQKLASDVGSNGDKE